MVRLFVVTNNPIDGSPITIRAGICYKIDYTSECIRDFSDDDLDQFMVSFETGVEELDYRRRFVEAQKRFFNR